MYQANQPDATAKQIKAYQKIIQNDDFSSVGTQKELTSIAADMPILSVTSCAKNGRTH